jgi:LPXTG-motif cell wall-anchored protein
MWSRTAIRAAPGDGAAGIGELRYRAAFTGIHIGEIMSRIIAAWARLGTGATVVAAVALMGVPTVAFAADPLPDLSVSFDRDPVADVDNSGTTVGMYVYNYGAAPATGVTVTLDVSNVSDAVTVSVPEWADQCKLGGTTVTCTIGQLEVGQVLTVQPLALASRQGAKPGAAGSVTVTIAGAEDDASPGDNTTSFPVTVIASGPDLVAAAQDLSTESDPLGPGDTVPLDAAVSNEGDTAATNFAITFSLPIGAALVERYSDCTYTDYWPNAIGQGYVYGPSEVTCVAPLTLEPSEALLLFDEETGESVFHAAFGRNLSGPEQHYGYFSVALADEVRAAKDSKLAGGNGPSFADAVRKLRADAAKRSLSRRQNALRELDDSNNYADFSFWSKKNTLDVAVTAPAVAGAVGQTVNLTYEVVNNGPSDGGGPRVVHTAPSGTVLLPADWCYTEGTENERLPESAALHCNFESAFPSVASGYGKIKPTVKLKIKSTPGTDGTIVVTSTGVGSTESTRANNTARIVITGGGDDGGTGGGLPVTGTPTGLLAGAGAGVLALGVALLVLFRRRRVVLETPRD